MVGVKRGGALGVNAKGGRLSMRELGDAIGEVDERVGS